MNTLTVNFKLLFIVLILCLALSFIKSTLSGKNLLKSYAKPSSKSNICKFLSNVISVDTKGDQYDLLMSFSTSPKEICNYICFVTDGTNPNIQGNSLENYNFSNENYTMLRFPGLKNFVSYRYICWYASKNTTYKEYGDIQFPKTTADNHSKIITFGDWSKTDKGIETYKLLMKNIVDTDAIVFVGDISYDLYKKNGEVGNDFLNFTQPFTSAIPFQMVTGNHETHNNFEDLKKRFIMPNKEKGENLYYSYDVKNTHFVAVNSEIPYQKQFTPEYIVNFTKWLEDDLTKTTKRWKVIYLHRPLYCSMPDDYHCISSSQKMRDLYEEILHKTNVDLVIAGHVHAYERLFPIYNNIVDIASIQADENVYKNPKYPTHLVCGTGGNREDYAKYKPGKNSKIVISVNGICQLDITDNKIDFKFIGGTTGETLDQFQIIKDKSVENGKNVLKGRKEFLKDVKNIME